MSSVGTDRCTIPAGQFYVACDYTFKLKMVNIISQCVKVILNLTQNNDETWEYFFRESANQTFQDFHLLITLCND